MLLYINCACTQAFLLDAACHSHARQCSSAGPHEGACWLLILSFPTLAQVGTHGSHNSYQFFMPPGTALVEILAWNFHGEHCTFADQYYK